MAYNDNEEKEFSEKYFPTTFYYNSEMAGKYNDKHVKAYHTWASWAMDIIYEKWYYYRSVRANLEEAEKTYNEMMNANLEFIEEDTWELLREKIINSLQLSKAHNTHAMTWGQAGRCIANDGRATWGTDCLFPSNMNEIIAMMSTRHKIIIQGANIFGLLNKRLDTMIEKVLSPSFRYNRAKKEAIEDEKRRKEFERHQAEIEKLKAEREQIQTAQTEAWEKLKKNPDSSEAEEWKTAINQAESQKRKMAEEMKELGLILAGLEKEEKKIKAEREKERPSNFADLWSNIKQGEMNNSEISSDISDDGSISSTESDVFISRPSSGKKWLLILGVIVAVIIGTIIYLVKRIAAIF